MEDQYKDKQDDKDISEAYKVLKDNWLKASMESEIAFDELEDEVIELRDEVYTLKAKLKIKNDTIERYNDNISEAAEMVQELSDLRKQNDDLRNQSDKLESEINKNVIEVKKYSNNDKRYENIMSHMDILWHEGEHGPDGCGKCESYRDIMMSAFDKVESMSSRNINLDFATTHVKYGKTVDNNNNHIYRDVLTGKIEGGDKDLSEFEDNCKT